MTSLSVSADHLLLLRVDCLCADLLFFLLRLFWMADPGGVRGCVEGG